LMYCAAQNSLGYSSRYYKSAWTEDSLELVTGKHLISDDDRLLVFVDDAFHPRLYRFRADADPELVLQWGYDANSASPTTFKEVLTRVKEHYPAQEYGLCMWSHADGWVPSSNTNYTRSPFNAPPTISPLSFGIDVGESGDMRTDMSGDGITIGAQMNIADMAKAIQDSGLHLTYIFFDACLMQCVEVAYELRDVTEYLIASPISIAAAGAYYTHLLERGFFSPNPTDIAKTYYEDVTSNELAQAYDDFGIVISAIKTSEMDALAEAVRTALADVDFTTYPDLTAAHAYHVYSYNYYYRPHYYDMRSALRHLLTDAQFAPVDEAITRATAFYAATHKYWVGPRNNDYHNITSDCCGISMFFPQKEYATNASRCDFGNHNETYRSTSWAHAIGKGN
ncbi:MAG: clostripain-related cysteine peptidase, partial [Prevotellamassilia sp.]|nr:clostripain-related cysteine peptidase [Prevotellamassilia sp.]